MKNFWLIVGRSGSGKDTLVDNLIEAHPNWTRVISKTTRPPRSKEDKHIFTDEAGYQKDLADGKIAAYNFYNGAHYWATYEQIEAADFYIVDIPGLIELREKYHGEKTLRAIGLLIEPSEAEERMRQRGDSEDAIAKRIAGDDAAFRDIRKHVDILVDTEDLDEDDMVVLAEDIIESYENL